MVKREPITALVVDDSAFMRNVLKDILTANGFSRVYEAKDGAEAVSLYAKLKPNLVTMDIVMPGTDGLEGLEGILNINPKAKVIMVTAVGQENIVREAMKLGAKDYIAKPFKPSVISSTVERVLELA